MRGFANLRVLRLLFGVKALQVQPGELGVLNSQVREIEDTVDGLWLRDDLNWLVVWWEWAIELGLCQKWVLFGDWLLCLLALLTEQRPHDTLLVPTELLLTRSRTGLPPPNPNFFTTIALQLYSFAALTMHCGSVIFRIKNWDFILRIGLLNFLSTFAHSAGMWGEGSL